MSRPLPSTWLFAAGLLALGVFVLWFNRDVSFFFDEWDFLLGRRGSGLDVYLLPHHEHIAIIPIATYKALLAVFGMSSPRPFQVAGVLVFLAALTAVYLHVRRRVGPWLALALVAPLAACGPGWDNVLWPFQMGFTGSIAAGVGALLAIERPSRRGDLLACLLLVVAMSFSSLGVAFALAATVSIALSATAWRPRVWVVAVPALLFALWFAGWGHEGDSFLSVSNLLQAPAFVVDGLASGLATLLGVGTVAADGATTTLEWGRPLLAIAAAAAAWRLARMRRVPPGVWVALSFGLGFWLLTAVNSNPFRLPDSGRYQLIGAVAVVLIAAELLQGLRISRAVTAGAVAVAAIAVVGNLAGLGNGRAVIRSASQLQRADFTAVEIARDSVAPEFTIGSELAGAPLYGDAALYLSAVDAYGSPAYTGEALVGAPEPARDGADRTLAAALGIGLEPATGDGGNCDAVELADGPVTLSLRPPRTLLLSATHGEATAMLRRYAQESFPVRLGKLSEGSPQVLDLPADRSSVPWQLQLDGATPVFVCDSGG